MIYKGQNKLLVKDLRSLIAANPAPYVFLAMLFRVRCLGSASRANNNNANRRDAYRV